MDKGITNLTKALARGYRIDELKESIKDLQTAINVAEMCNNVKLSDKLFKEQTLQLIELKKLEIEELEDYLK